MWKRYKLSELGILKTGTTPKTSEKENFGNDIPFIKPADFGSEGTINYENDGLSEAGAQKSRVTKANSVLMVCIGATIGKVGFTDRDVTTNQQINSIELSPEINTKFLYYIMKTSKFQKLVIKSSSQATLPIINKKKWGELELQIPPLIEQQRIVAKLDAAFAEIDKTIEVANVKKVELDKLKDRTLATLLKGNEQMSKTLTLGDSSTFTSRGISPKYIEKGGICVLNQKCIRNHKVNYEFSRRHNIEIKKVSEERFIRKGDLLINSTGQGTLGRVAQVKEEPKEITTVDSHVTIVRPRHELFYPSYFGYAAISIENLIKSAGQGTSGQTELAKSAVQNDFQITFPICHDEQKNVVDKLNQAFKQFENAFNKNKEIQTNYLSLKSAILAQELQSSEAA